MKKYIFFGILSVMSVCAFGQVIILDALSDKKTERTCTGRFYDSGGSLGNYKQGENYSITIQRNNSLKTIYPMFTFDTFDVNSVDTLYIHDGPDTLAPLLSVGIYGHKYANNANSILGDTIAPSCTNETGALTFRFVSKSNTTPTAGWVAKIECRDRCEDFEVTLDSTFYKINNDDWKPDAVRFNLIDYKIDTIAARLGLADSIDTIYYNAVDLCHGIGDSIVLSAKAEYKNSSCYTLTPNSKYHWVFGNGKTDSVTGNQGFAYYPAATGYDLALTVVDQITGCNAILQDTRVRIAKNLMKRIKPIPDLCTGELYRLNIGYSASAQIVIDTSTEVKEAMGVFSDTLFVPDGPNCPELGRCYVTEIEFTQYPPGKTVVTGNDICGVCFNAEHSFIGDLGIYLVCPSGKRAALMTYNGSAAVPDELVAQGYPQRQPPTNGGRDLGLALSDGNRQITTPGVPSSDYRCRQDLNKHGTGWNYCFSETYTDNNLGHMGPASRSNASTPMDSSDYANKSRFYIPDTSFNELIGCPLNGKWAIQVCDFWGADRGYMFNWSLEFCKANTNDWGYKVVIDSVLWDGPFLRNQTPETTELFPDTAGDFKYKVTVVDNLLCKWDTTVDLKVVQTPQIKINDGMGDISVCSYKTGMTLDCGVPDTNQVPNQYIWEPTGERTKTIQVPDNLQSTTQYRVEVITSAAPPSEKKCNTVDSITVKVLPTPTPSFLPDILPSEGCMPLNVEFANTSGNTDEYEWYFGDGTSSSEESPTHLYANPGTYDVTLVAKNTNGCVDTISLPGLVKVFSKPEAEFNWNPMNPTLLDPTIKFNNLTVPQSAENVYIWQIQDNLEDPLSFTYIFDSVNPYYTFPTDKGSKAAGNYTVSLIASTKNKPSSGYRYECADTATHEITLINDFLQIPNVVTANGDGINDVFRIGSLTKGTAFPNNELHIYDRTGRTIYYKRNMTENDAWDPKAEKISSGTYFYKFVIKGLYKDSEYNGTIEVIVN